MLCGCDGTQTANALLPHQVDFLKMLYDKMVELHHQYADTPRGINFPRPSFKVCMLLCI